MHQPVVRHAVCGLHNTVLGSCRGRWDRTPINTCKNTAFSAATAAICANSCKYAGIGAENTANSSRNEKSLHDRRLFVLVALATDKSLHFCRLSGRVAAHRVVQGNTARIIRLAGRRSCATGCPMSRLDGRRAVAACRLANAAC